nr:molybdenum cofactor guanylyltransferase [Paracidobacterium acidisoli]
MAGGRSLRMGRDKALLEVNGRPLIELALEKLRELGFTPRIAGLRPDLEGFAPVVFDRQGGGDERCGPLAGIEAALAASDEEVNLFLPVDLPLLPGAFLRWLARRAETTQAPATIPTVNGRAQPLCSVYRRELLPGLSEALREGRYRVMTAVEEAAQGARGRMDVFDVEAVAAALQAGEWPQERPVYEWFRNLNAPDDVAAVEQTAPSIHHAGH